MTTDFNTGSTLFGPLNDAVRNYLITAVALPNSDWSWVCQFRAGNGMGSKFCLMFADATMTGTGTGGSNYYLGFGRAEHSTVADRNILAAQVKHSGVDICNPAAQLLGTTVMTPGLVYYAVLQRRSNFIELYTILAGSTVLTYDVQKTATSATLNLASTGGALGTNFTGNYGWFAQFNQSFSTSELTSIAGGTDPDTIVTSSGNRKSFVQFTNAGNTLTNQYGGANPTANGTWTNQPTCGSLAAPPVATNYILMTEMVSGTVYPANAVMGSAVSATFSGTYSGTSYTPSAMDYQIIDAQSLAVVQSWAALTSFTASAGSWSGVAAMPEGTSTNPTFMREVRDHNTTSITYRSGNWFGVAATVLNLGQSQANNTDTQNAGTVSLSGTLFGWYSNAGTLIQPYMSTVPTASAGCGAASAANRFYTLSGGKPYARYNAAVVGTSIRDWAGFYVTEQTSSCNGYTDGELVTIMVNGVNKGTAIIMQAPVTNVPGPGTSGTPADSGLSGTGSSGGASSTTMTVKNAQFSFAQGVKTTATATYSSASTTVPITAPNANIFVGALVTGTNINAGTTVASYDGNVTVVLNQVPGGVGTAATLSFYITTITGQSSGTITAVKTADNHAANSETFVPMQSIVSALSLTNCYLRVMWLQGSSDSGSYYAEVLAIFLARFDAYMTSLGITYKFFFSPQCRVTNATTGAASTRLQQVNAVKSHAYFGTKLALGLPLHDITMLADTPYSGSVIQAGSDTTHTVMGTDFDAATGDVPTSLSILTSTNNAGVTKTVSSYVVATFKAAHSAWASGIACAAGDVGTTFGSGPHENRYGANSWGFREGAMVALDAGITAVAAVGPSLVRALIPPNGDGTVIYVYLAFPTQGLSFGTPLGVAANTYGFEVSADGFNTLKTISLIEWISANVVKITLSAAVTGIVSFEVLATTTLTSTTLTLNSGADSRIVANMGIFGDGVSNLTKVSSYASGTTLVMSTTSLRVNGPTPMTITNLAVRYLPSSPVPTPDGPRRLGDILCTNSGLNVSGEPVWPTFPALAVKYDRSACAAG